MTAPDQWHTSCNGLVRPSSSKDSSLPRSPRSTSALMTSAVSTTSLHCACDTVSQGLLVIDEMPTIHTSTLPGDSTSIATLCRDSSEQRLTIASGGRGTTCCSTRPTPKRDEEVKCAAEPSTLTVRTDLALVTTRPEPMSGYALEAAMRR